MEFTELKRIAAHEGDKKVQAAYHNFDVLISALKKKEIPDEIGTAINGYIDAVNLFDGAPKDLRKTMKSSRAKILSLVEKELKLVPKGHYMTRWMAIGMTAFGIPIGVAIGASSGNMGTFIAVGIAVGMGMGVAIGAAKDKEALDADLQLDISA